MLVHFNLRISLLVLAGALQMSACQGTRPGNLGVTEGALAPCPEKPNCVSSTARNPEQKVEPIALNGDRLAAFEKLKVVIGKMPRVTVVKDEPHYLHAEFTSKFWRFVDDFEVYFNEKAGHAEVRSASRLGYRDFGVNRERVESVRQLFADQSP